MKKIDLIDLVFVIFMMGGLAVMIAMTIMFGIFEYQETQSRMEWRESSSLATLEMVKREAVNEYISKQEGI